MLRQYDVKPLKKTRLAIYPFLYHLVFIYCWVSPSKPILGKSKDWKAYTYFDCAEKFAAAKTAASTSTLSCESRLWRILWWAFFLSGIIDARLPNMLQKQRNPYLDMSEKLTWIIYHKQNFKKSSSRIS